MIELSDEMVALFDGCEDVAVYEGDNVPAILRDLLAILARDRCLKPQGHVFHPLAKPIEAGPCPVRFPSAPGVTLGGLPWFCELRYGHEGDHESGPTRWTGPSS